MTSKEQFNEWFYEYTGCNPKDSRYVNMVEMYWMAWQASRAAIEIELPTTIEVHPLGPSAAKMFCELHKNTVAECAKSILAAGLKVKS